MIKMILVGKHIGHSKSPDIYAAAYKILGEALDYTVYDIDNCFDAYNVLSNVEFDAANITTPFKSVPLPRQCMVDSTVSEAGGANLLISNGKNNNQAHFSAYNTDGDGCVSFLKKIEALSSNSKVAIFGTGCTSKAIAYALKRAGVEDTCFLSRREHRKCVFIPCHTYWESEGKKRIAQSDIIIDASSCGMLPDDVLPFDGGLLSSRQIILDTVYGHGKTPIAHAAESAACTFFDGTGMLISQAIAALHRIMDKAYRGFAKEIDDVLFEAMIQSVAETG